MSYIAFDLDALNVARDVGAAANIPEERVTHGLLRMWAWCFREKTQHVTNTHVRGFFGADAAAALQAFGFLAPADGFDCATEITFRVRGAERYLRVSEARSRAGKARAASAGRAAGRLTSNTQHATSTSPAHAGDSTSTPPALTPSTEHRAPNTEHRAAAEPSPLTTPEGFWVACQDLRDAIPGMVRELPPPHLGSWFSEAMMHVHGDEQRLLAGYRVFLLDPFWRNQAKQRCHWGGWVKQWRDFVTRAHAAPVATTDKSTRAPQPTHDWADVTPGEVTFG